MFRILHVRIELRIAEQVERIRWCLLEDRRLVVRIQQSLPSLRRREICQNIIQVVPLPHIHPLALVIQHCLLTANGND